MDRPWAEDMDENIGASKTPQPAVLQISLHWGSGDSGYLTTPSSSLLTNCSSNINFTPSDSAIELESSDLSTSQHESKHQVETPKLKPKPLRRRSICDSVPSEDENIISSWMKSETYYPTSCKVLKRQTNVSENELYSVDEVSMYITSSSDRGTPEQQVYSGDTTIDHSDMKVDKNTSDLDNDVFVPIGKTQPYFNYYGCNSTTETTTRRSDVVSWTIPEGKESDPDYQNTEVTRPIGSDCFTISRQESKSCPTTPTKNVVQYNRSSNSSPESVKANDMQYIPILRTPEKKTIMFTPIIRREVFRQGSVCDNSSPNSKKSSVKHLNFNAKSPKAEKNKILYPRLPITPTKRKSPSQKTFKRIISYKKLGIRYKVDYTEREKLDLIFMLGYKSLQWPVIEKILGYLSSEDLCSFCMVSSYWKNVCLSDPHASRRRLEHIRKVQELKENITEHLLPIEETKTEVTPDMEHCSNRKAFLEIQNRSQSLSNMLETPSTSKSPPVSPKGARFLKYLKVGQSLDRFSRVRRCPHCSFPSKLILLDSEYRCTSAVCGFTFCMRCNCPSHAPQSCLQSQQEITNRSPPRPDAKPVLRTRAGTLQSRKNLRRL